ncbi:MAG: DUF1064 domain-containing protein [Candidatus Omnitrophota bacterium]|nr:DUF1064 domain-containing protein [Candidatus Omnitrophota bacterium]
MGRFGAKSTMSRHWSRHPRLTSWNRPSKFGNRLTTLDGYTFGSAREAKEYLLLKAMLKSGAILQLDVHPVVELQPTPQRITMIPDFHVVYAGTAPLREEWIEVKGVWTAAAKLKLKLWQAKFPQRVLRVVEV